MYSKSLDSTLFPGDFQNNDNWGRLFVADDGDATQVWGFGGRGFTIFKADGTLVYNDGGALVAEAYTRVADCGGTTDTTAHPERYTCGGANVQPVCQGDHTTWMTGGGTPWPCEMYAPGKSEYQFCATDTDYDGLRAEDACPQCGKCTVEATPSNYTCAPPLPLGDGRCHADADCVAGLHCGTANCVEPWGNCCACSDRYDDGASDVHGPRPESVTTGKVDGSASYAPRMQPVAF